MGRISLSVMVPHVDIDIIQVSLTIYRWKRITKNPSNPRPPPLSRCGLRKRGCWQTTGYCLSIVGSHHLPSSECKKNPQNLPRPDIPAIKLGEHPKFWFKASDFLQDSKILIALMVSL
jgi:hypothetical protein